MNVLVARDGSHASVPFEIIVSFVASIIVSFVDSIVVCFVAIDSVLRGLRGYPI